MTKLVMQLLALVIFAAWSQSPAVMVACASACTFIGIRWTFREVRRTRKDGRA